MRWAVWLVVVACLCVPAQASWRITKDHWSAADEAGFGRFVAAIGNSDCSSSESCLRDPSNPYRATDEHFKDIDVDCAKWPYLLRAYYAWKNGLPFSFVDAVAGSGDERHSRLGNRPAGRRDFIDHGNGIDGPKAVNEVIDTVFSGSYRSDASKDGPVHSDFYPPALQPGSIRPGTVIYDTNAHVGIVYKVDKDGRIYYMDAHPDFTVTRSVYGAQFGQSPVQLGGGLKNWRPLQLKDAHRDAEGHLIGGHIAMAKNKDIPDYSLVQYVGTEPNPTKDVKKAHYIYDGAELGLYEYVRVAVSGGKATYNPVYELKATIRTLCNDLDDRAQTVDNAISVGVQNWTHPDALPENIYDSTDDAWESYATPARDSRTRAAFIQFYKDMAEMIDLWVHRDPRIVYDGYDLKDDLLKAYDSQSKACTVTYLNSAKQPVPITFDDMVHRVYAISFDPYDCIELRWGAQGDERKTCTDGRKKLRWYAAEQKLRDSQVRATHVAYDLDALEGAKADDDPPPVDVRALIENMPYQVPLQPMRPVGR